MLRLCYHTDLDSVVDLSIFNNCSLGKSHSANQPWFVMFANFHGVNAPAQPILGYLRDLTECRVGKSCAQAIVFSPQALPAGSSKPLPRFHFWLQQLVYGTQGKLFNFFASPFSNF